MLKTIIQVKNLNKKYESFSKQAGLFSSFKQLFRREKIIVEAVKNVNFEIEEGEFVGFVGPNGAGKTTTLKMLSGILMPSGGSARVLGFIPHKRQEKYQKQFALVMGQKNQLWWDLPPMESFLLNKEIYEIGDKQFSEILDELTDLLKVGDLVNKPVRKLSLGERMKCELILALLHQPKILFLDEPTIGLDVVAQKNIRDFLKKYNQEKKVTILLTSHYMEDIARLCPRIIIINLGQIIYDGVIDKLIQQYASHKKIDIFFESEVSRQEVSGFGEIREFDPLKVSLDVPRGLVKETATKILASDLPVKDIDIKEIGVDSVIRNIFTQPVLHTDDGVAQ